MLPSLDKIYKEYMELLWVKTEKFLPISGSSG